MFDSERLFIILICIGIPLSAVFVYFDAKKRGKRDREALWWAAGTLFLVIFVLPAWLWSRPNFQVETDFLCPECKEVYRGKRISCPNCGYMVVEDEITDLSGPEDEDEKKPRT
jgi:hypothetical protein